MGRARWKTSFWMYKGIPLSDFCRIKKLSYSSVLNRVYKENINLEDAVKKTLERKGQLGMNAKYFYKGMKIKEACKKYGINSSSIYYRIRERNMTVEQAFERTLSPDSHKWSDHLWKLSDGTPLIRYCKDNNVNYSNVLKRLSDSDISVDEALKRVVEHKMKLERIRNERQKQYAS